MVSRRVKLGTVAQLREEYHTLRCPVVNYLLDDVDKGGEPGKKRREDAFKRATYEAYFALVGRWRDGGCSYEQLASLPWQTRCSNQRMLVSSAAWEFTL
jgi:hypothetical protein